jgi:hypothetical protein
MAATRAPSGRGCGHLRLRRLDIGADEVKPETIPMMRFSPVAAKPRWKFW